MLQTRLSPGGARKLHGFTIMEILVVVAIILVLAAIIFPVYSTVLQRKHKTAALNMMKQLATASSIYASQNDNELPSEDSKGTDTWQVAAEPANSKAWYNSLPKILGMKTVGEFSNTPKDFYTSENLIYLPGAIYPESDKKLVRPLFAVAINTKLQRKEKDGDKPSVRLSQITHPSRTVLWLEQGLPSEQKSLAVQPKYDGSCKGSAKSFVGRYSGVGLLAFVDGHAETAEAKKLLTETGKFPFPVVDVQWCQTPEMDPNK